MDECLTLEDLGASINLMPLSVWKRLSLRELTPTYFDADPRVPLILERSFLKTGRALIDVFEGELTLRVGKEAITFNLDQTSRYSANYNDNSINRIDVIEMASKSDKSLIDEPPEVELKDLPPHLKYSFLEGDDKLPVIIAKDLSMEEKIALITVLKSHNPWVSPVHCVPKKCGFTVVENEKNELILTRLVMGWRVCIDYHKLNEATCKDHFPLSFMDQMLERLVGNQYYCFLTVSLGISKFPSIRKIRKKPHSLSHTECLLNAACLLGYAMHLARFRVFGNSFQSCLSHLEKMLKRCEDTNVCLNLDKSHFMVKDDLELPEPLSVIGGMHFCNDQFAKVMLKFGVTHRLATPYHPQTSDQAEVSNRGLKPYNTPIGCTPYKLVYGKTTGDHRKVQLNELNEVRDQAYENSLIYKEKTKRLHDSKIKDRVFNIDDRVLFNSRLKIFSGKLKSCWSGPFTISHVYPYGTVKLSQPSGPNFKVNGHRLKHYFGEDVPKLVVPDLQTFPKDH
nr:reverse transcriptase domain-containing protein [Tanacetum cinerariifolium]